MCLMKTILASSPHCSVFRCQALAAIDLLLKNKYGAGRRNGFYLKCIRKNAFIFRQSVDLLFLFHLEVCVVLLVCLAKYVTVC